MNSDMTCTVKTVIYVIDGRLCNKYYICETNNLRKTTTLHNQHIRHEHLHMIPLSGHIASSSRNDSHYFMFPFYKMKTESIIDWKEKEKYFIKKIQTRIKPHIKHLKIRYQFCIRYSCLPQLLTKHNVTLQWRSVITLTTLLDQYRTHSIH